MSKGKVLVINYEELAVQGYNIYTNSSILETYLLFNIFLYNYFKKCNTTHYNYQNTDKNGHFLNR